MKKLITFLLPLFLLVLQPLNSEAQEVYTATLSGHQEVPPVASNASGEITVTLIEDTLQVQGIFQNLGSETDTTIVGGAHIHMAYAGQNGPVQFPITAAFDPGLQGGAFNPAENSFILTEEQKSALRQRRLYVNIHTLNNQGGELRGQLLPAADSYYSLTLTGSQENPPVMSGGIGALILEVSGDTLIVSGSFSGLESDFATNIAGGAHLHNANAAANGGIVFPLNSEMDAGMRSAVFEADSNKYELTAEQRRMLENRQIYANIHSTQYPGGELRGQVTGMPKAVFRAQLSGTQENPAVGTQARGVIMAELTMDDSLIVHGGFSQLESDFATNIAGGAHIHNAPAGRNGGIVFPLNSEVDPNMRAATFEADSNSFALDTDQLDMLFARGLYTNIHSALRPSGEIRGQLLAESQIYFQGNLSSIFTVPAIKTNAHGVVLAELNGTTLRLAGSFNGFESNLAVDIAGGAHIHDAMAGRTGPVIFPLSAGLTEEDSMNGVFLIDENIFALEEEQVNTLRTRGYYVNIHSLDNPSGEIRAQLLPYAQMVMVSRLSGTSHGDPIRTDANGMAILELTNDRLSVHGSFNELGSDFNEPLVGGAHIHLGMAGQNGPIVIPLEANVDTTDIDGIWLAEENRYILTQGAIDTMRWRMNYVNVHSLDIASGEIRGQILPLATAHFTTSLLGSNENPPVESDGRGALKAELHGNELTISGAFSGLSADLDTSIAGGSHIHMGVAGMNGGIVFPLTVSLNDDLTQGFYLNEENSWTLDEDQLALFLGESMYANLHSLNFPSGELRGQLLNEDNQFPTDGANITAPADGAELTIEGDSSTTLNIAWDEAEDENLLIYDWEVAATEDFNEILIRMPRGQATEVTLTYGMLDSILNDLGVAEGESVLLYHRAVASDGSVATPGGSASVELTRGVLLDVNELDVLGIDYTLSPNLIFQGQDVGVTVESGVSADGNLVIVDGSGRLVQKTEVRLQSGREKFSLDTGHYGSGMYYFFITIDGKQGPVRPLIVQ